MPNCESFAKIFLIVDEYLVNIFFFLFPFFFPAGSQYACLSNPCQNGGQCVNQGANYRCICQNGYIGTNCETVAGQFVRDGCGWGKLGQVNHWANYDRCTCVKMDIAESIVRLSVLVFSLVGDKCGCGGGGEWGMEVSVWIMEPATGVYARLDTSEPIVKRLQVSS